MTFPPARPPQAYRPEIDGLRALAVLMVVGYHYAPKTFRGGFVGVDVFFVISGFLISRIIVEHLDHATFSIADFYARRARRILPALALVLAATLAFGALFFFPSDLQQAGKHAAAGSLFASNFALWSESGYFDASAETKPFLHLWSLGIEEQFYIFWPLILWFGVKARRPLALVAVLALASLAVDLADTRMDSSAAFYSPASRAWELMIGAWLGVAASRWAEQPGSDVIHAANPRALLGLAMLIAAFASIDAARPYPGAWALLPSVGTALLISAGPAAWINRRLLSLRPLVALGLVSYPLYLWHWPLLVCARLTGDGIPGRSERALLLVLSFVLAWGTYRFVELPIRHGRARTRLTTLSFCAVAVAGLAGACCFLGDGFPGRLPAAIRPIATTPPATSGWREGSCFLRSDQEARAFANCPSGSGSGKPVLLLWGDSEAAQLRPGYERYFSGYRLVQRTASGCRPIVGIRFVNQPRCRDINESILRSLDEIRPDRVVLAGRWLAIDWTQLSRTIQALHARGIHAIDLIGPAPEWDGALPRLLYGRFRKDPDRPLADRTNDGLAPEIAALDTSMASFARAQGVRYESVRSTLCTAQGCLALMDGQATAWDSFHLTLPAASLVVSRFAGAVDAAASAPRR